MCRLQRVKELEAQREKVKKLLKQFRLELKYVEDKAEYEEVRSALLRAPGAYLVGFGPLTRALRGRGASAEAARLRRHLHRAGAGGAGDYE